MAMHSKGRNQRKFFILESHWDLLFQYHSSLILAYTNIPCSLPLRGKCVSNVLSKLSCNYVDKKDLPKGYFWLPLKLQPPRWHYYIWLDHCEIKTWFGTLLFHIVCFISYPLLFKIISCYFVFVCSNQEISKPFGVLVIEF